MGTALCHDVTLGGTVEPTDPRRVLLPTVSSGNSFTCRKSDLLAKGFIPELILPNCLHFRMSTIHIFCPSTSKVSLLIEFIIVGNMSLRYKSQEYFRGSDAAATL